MMRRIAVLCLATSLAACASGGGSAGAPASASRAPGGAIPDGFRSPQLQRERGLEAVIGKPAAALTRRFGPPRINLVEGDARKLQFTGEACVIDVFLYPLGPGAEPVATHVEARQRKDGSPADRAACLREVEARRREGR